jgi:hypothetical protein
MADSFILGISSGSACLVTCGMIMFPYLMAGAASFKQIAFDISVFLVTRLIVYFILATIAWYFGQAVFTTTIVRNYLPGVLYIMFAALLIWYSIDKNRKRDCPAAIIKNVENRKHVPFLLGIVNSIGFCPALLIILTKGATQLTMTQSYLVFLAFFAGSSLWFIPLPFAGMVKRRQVLQIIGTFATGIAGLIFIIRGFTMLIGGIING